MGLRFRDFGAYKGLKSLMDLVRLWLADIKKELKENQTLDRGLPLPLRLPRSCDAHASLQSGILPPKSCRTRHCLRSVKGLELTSHGLTTPWPLRSLTFEGCRRLAGRSLLPQALRCNFTQKVRAYGLSVFRIGGSGLGSISKLNCLKPSKPFGR